MRASAMIRIVIWTIVALLLVCLLVAGMKGGKSLFIGNIKFPGFSGSYLSYDDSRYKVVSKAVVETANLDSIEIDWLSGSVEVVMHDGDSVEFEEFSAQEVLPDHQMRFAVEEGILKIRFARSGIRLISPLNSFGKTLILRIPRSLALEKLSVNTVSARVEDTGAGANKYSIKTVSGAVTISDVDAGNMNLNTTSGRISVSSASAVTISAGSTSGRVDLSGVAAQEIGIDTVSGRIEVGGEFEGLSIGTTSGSVDVNSREMPQRISISSVSGSITLRLPENDGFEISYSSISGSFNCDFDVKHSNRTATHKGGGSNIRLKTVSGSMRVREW